MRAVLMWFGCSLPAVAGVTDGIRLLLPSHPPHRMTRSLSHSVLSPACLSFTSFFSFSFFFFAFFALIQFYPNLFFTSHLHLSLSCLSFVSLLLFHFFPLVSLTSLSLRYLLCVESCLSRLLATLPSHSL